MGVADAGLGKRDFRGGPAAPLWMAIQWAGLLAVVGLLGALVRWPEPTLDVLWYAIVPLLPVTFLVNTRIWRNVCPLATLNTLTGDRLGKDRLGGRAADIAGALGVALLLVVVPARHVISTCRRGSVLLVCPIVDG